MSGKSRLYSILNPRGDISLLSFLLGKQCLLHCCLKLRRVDHRSLKLLKRGKKNLDSAERDTGVCLDPCQHNQTPLDDKEMYRTIH